ncbi:MAG TPA: phosphate ABC transporter permease subunit PstC [Ktedonobacteraceae bacterium]|nr:phosphate ABC transporter permease subunit PstC [Ktedonobacteraceae bacterium]
MPYSQRARLADIIARAVFFICAILLIAVIVAVFIFIGSKAFRVFTEGADVKTFFTVDNWDPTGLLHTDANGNVHPSFGGGGLILGSIVITLGSLIIVTPLALLTAVFFTEMAPAWLVRFLQPLVEIFTGVPSVVIGFLGLTVLVPFLSKLVTPFAKSWGILAATGGFGWGAAILVLVIMVLPTVLSISIDSLRAVPGSVREASLALGSTRWQMMRKAIIPAASTGLGTAVVLGLARAIGETLAVAMVLQGSGLPQKLFALSALFQPNVNVTMMIAQDFGESFGASQDAYWTLAFVLLVVSFLFVCISRYLASRSVYR